MEQAIQIPEQYLCPITTELMKDPVIAADGITYQRKSIQQWMKRSNDSAFTGKRLSHKAIIPNYALKNAIQNFSKSMPKFMKQNQIRIDLQYAIKIKDQQIKAFVNKIQQKNSKSEKQDENHIMKIKQLERQLMIERKSHSQTQKKFFQQQDKRMAYELKVQDLYQQIQDLKKKQCNCHNIKSNNIIKVDQINILNNKLISSPERQIKSNKLTFQKYDENLKKSLQGVKKIQITPNRKGWYFTHEKYATVDEKNKNLVICAQTGARIFSNQELPIKNQSFYFSINVLQIKLNNYIQVGVAYPDKVDVIFDKTYNNISYFLGANKIDIFGQKAIQLPKYTNKIKQLPSQLIVFVNQKDNTMQIIYNDKAQITVSLDERMKNHKNKCYAFVWIYQNSKIQFT